MKTKLFLFMMLFLLPFFLKAKSQTTTIKLGMNISKFRTEGGESKPGICFGIAKDFYPVRSFDGFFGLGLDYIRKQVKLKDRTWPTGTDINTANVVVGDLMLNISCIDISVNTGYAIQLNKGVSVNLMAGISRSIPIIDHKEGSKIKSIIFLDSEDVGEYDFDYNRLEEFSTSTTVNIHYGARFVFLQHIAICLYYSRALSDTKGFAAPTVSDKLDSFHVFAAYAF